MTFFTDKWAARYLDLASNVGGWSKDTSTKVGCIIASPDGVTLATGFNGLARGVADLPERMERPAKYVWTVHAEAAAVANAARSGARLDGAIAFVTHKPCSDCARLLINAGIRKIVTRRPDAGLAERFAESFAVADAMLGEAGVEVVYLQGEE